MEDFRILNVNDLKALCRCFESDRPKPFENTLQASINCLIWNQNGDALMTGYGHMLNTLSNDF